MFPPNRLRWKMLFGGKFPPDITQRCPWNFREFWLDILFGGKLPPDSIRRCPWNFREFYSHTYSRLDMLFGGIFHRIVPMAYSAEIFHQIALNENFLLLKIPRIFTRHTIRRNFPPNSTHGLFGGKLPPNRSSKRFKLILTISSIPLRFWSSLDDFSTEYLSWCLFGGKFRRIGHANNSISFWQFRPFFHVAEFWPNSDEFFHRIVSEW